MIKLTVSNIEDDYDGDVQSYDNDDEYVSDGF